MAYSPEPNSRGVQIKRGDRKYFSKTTSRGSNRAKNVPLGESFQNYIVVFLQNIYFSFYLTICVKKWPFLDIILEKSVELPPYN